MPQIAINDLPEILTAKDIRRHLQASRSFAYHLMSISTAAGGIPSFKIGSSPRTYREDYLAWLASRPTNAGKE